VERRRSARRRSRTSGAGTWSSTLTARTRSPTTGSTSPVASTS
jgi:hypothetical protein